MDSEVKFFTAEAQRNRREKQGNSWRTRTHADDRVYA